MKRKRINRSVKFPEPSFLPRAQANHKWKDVYVRHVFYLTLLGATDAQLCQVFDIHTNLLDTWKRTKPKFMEAIRRGKMEADGRVAYSLYLAATGYSHEDEVILTNRIKRRDSKGNVIEEYTEPLRVKTVKNYPPNVTAAIKWLQSRQPERWGHKMQVEGTIKHQHELDLTKFTTEELSVLSKLGVSDAEVEDVNYTEEEIGEGKKYDE